MVSFSIVKRKSERKSERRIKNALTRSAAPSPAFENGVKKRQ
jgi:hypothetical protein